MRVLLVGGRHDGEWFNVPPHAAGGDPFPVHMLEPAEPSVESYRTTHPGTVSTVNTRLVGYSVRRITTGNRVVCYAAPQDMSDSAALEILFHGSYPR